MLTTSAAAARGERLYPARSHRLYWHLTCLRSRLQEIIQDQLQATGDTTLVDYGCGNMPYRPLFEPHVHEYLGYDLPGNELASGLLNSNGEIQRESGSADFVLSSQVLEHVSDPARYLCESKRVLAGAGKLILSTHGVWRYHPDPRDYWRWTCDGLQKILTDNGFEILRFEGVMGPVATSLQLLQDATLPRVPHMVKTPFTWTMQRLMERADKNCLPVHRNQDACVYVVVATPR